MTFGCWAPEARHLTPEFSRFESSHRLQEFSLNSTTSHFHFPASVDFLSAALSIPCFPWRSQIKSRFSPEVGDFLVFLCFSANFLFQHWAPCWIFIYWENIWMIWNYQKWGEGLWRGVWQTDWKLGELSSSSECQVNSFPWTFFWLCRHWLLTHRWNEMFTLKVDQCRIGYRISECPFSWHTSTQIWTMRTHLVLVRQKEAKGKASTENFAHIAFITLQVSWTIEDPFTLDF